MFKNGRLREGAYVLVDDEWRKVENLADATLANYSAYIASFSNLPIVEGGAVSMPLQGVVDGIDGVSQTDARAERTYNLSGQRSTSQHGVLVKKNKKFIRK